MSRSEDGSRRALARPYASRRQFLTRTALAAVGSTVAATLPAKGRTASAAEPVAAPSKCPAVKTPMKDVEGKVAFITGGSSGIGLGIARAFADAGMKVVIGYRTPSHLDEALKKLQAASG